MASEDELACVYSALILHDDDVAVTAEKIQTILKAANVSVEPYWPGLFAKALEGIDLKQLITNVGSAVGGGGTVTSAAAAVTEEAPKEEAKKEEVKEESEESDEDMGFGLFD
ncbi:60S acidic ribosomal protein P1-like [Limulus polyphemus]|uniref:Large ribosomal subunit protein P1 n=1 Tax=Limulus polyphemus TaxID=6850 RepID=A0ABM1B096_LIMPO|nr:60S acidic ribosomal protein P1-like [Limulus polyphemus]